MENASSFVRVLGAYPAIRLWDFLLLTRGLYDYSLSQIAENAGISWDTLHRAFPLFIELGVVRETRRISRARMFALDEQNPITQAMVRIYQQVNEACVEAELGNRRLAVRACGDHH